MQKMSRDYMGTYSAALKSNQTPKGSYLVLLLHIMLNLSIDVLGDAEVLKLCATLANNITDHIKVDDLYRHKYICLHICKPIIINDVL